MTTREEGAVAARRGLGLLDRLARWRPWQIALVAVALSLPALGTGWQLDDHFQRLVLTGRVEGVGRGEMFSALRAGSERIDFYRDWGTLPWWTGDDFHLAFLRPLAVELARLDTWLWPHSSVAMHVHSLLWLGALVWLAAALYRRLLVAAPVAALAGLLFAVDEAYGTVAAWLANRNALIAIVGGLAALAAHDRWRRRGVTWAAWVAPLLLAAGLAGGEAALGALAYLVAYALFVDRAPVARRWIALAPYAAVVAAWAVLYRTLGYGVGPSGVYLDPVTAPLGYLEAIAQRGPFLLLGLWTPLPADLGGLTHGGLRLGLWLLAVGLLAPLAVALWRVLRRDRMAAFLAVGSLGALLPVCATLASNRLLLFAGFGASGLVALFVDAVRRNASPSGARRGLRVLAGALLVVHLGMAAALRPLTSYSLRWLGDPVARAARELPGGETLDGRVLVILSAPDFLLYVSNLVSLRTLERLPMPRQIRALSVGPSPLTVERVDRSSLRLEIPGGMPSGPLAGLFNDRLPAVGEPIALPGWTATVREKTAQGRAAVVDYRFDEDLDDPALAWVVWRGDGYAPFDLPAVGERAELPAPEGAFDGLWGVGAGAPGR